MQPFHWFGWLAAFCLAGGVLEADDIHAAFLVWRAATLRPAPSRDTHNEQNCLCLDLGSPEEEKTIHAFSCGNVDEVAFAEQSACKRMRVLGLIWPWQDVSLTGLARAEAGHFSPR